MFRCQALCLAVVLSAAAAPALAAAHSQVEATATAGVDRVDFRFKVQMDKDLHLNMEGPWKLQLEPGADLPLAQTVLGKDAVDTAYPGFQVATAAKPKAASGTLPYTLTAFVCTNDKTQCYRDVHKGTVAWHLK